MYWHDANILVDTTMQSIIGWHDEVSDVLARCGEMIGWYDVVRWIGTCAEMMIGTCAVMIG